MNALLQQGGAGFRGGLGVGAQALCDGVAAEAASGAGAEQRVTAPSGAFVEPGAQQVLDVAVEWDGALLRWCAGWPGADVRVGR